jgi:CubicO group peptidase (beta-lactamase class C family)
MKQNATGRVCWAVIALTASFRAIAAPDDAFAVALQERMPGLLATNRVPGAVVSYIKNGEVAWTKAFGVANLQTGTPMQPDMVFNHASDSKVLTAWGIMRLVEQGKMQLDAPANRYLKRWKIRSTKFDADGVTIRRLLSHTAGLTVPLIEEYPDFYKYYRQDSRLPSLVEVLEGIDKKPSPVFIKWQPGSTNAYSNGGYWILQMVIEDVSGESFAVFMQREVARPLGLSSLEWAWTPQLEKRAPTPYDAQQKEAGYLQLACQAVGSGNCTVSDFARFVAAAVPGPHGEPVGRGVLKPATVAQMLEIQPNTEHGGLGYGISLIKGEKFLSHVGMNPGWTARFALAVNRREGFVIANNSSLGLSLNQAIEDLWLEPMLGRNSVSEHR